jgi:hypothetical protein
VRTSALSSPAGSWYCSKPIFVSFPISLTFQ